MWKLFFWILCEAKQVCHSEERPPLSDVSEHDIQVISPNNKTPRSLKASASATPGVTETSAAKEIHTIPTEGSKSNWRGTYGKSESGLQVVGSAQNMLTSQEGGGEGWWKSK